MHPSTRPVVAIALMASLSVALCCAGPRLPRAPRPDVPHLAVMTYNVNYGLAGDPGVVDAIDQADVDAVFLQETSPAWERALRAALGARYPYMAFRHGRGAGGMAVLSKVPFRDADYIPPPDGGWFHGWRVVLDTPAGAVQVLQVHLRPALSDSGDVFMGLLTTGPIRQRQIAAYAARLQPDVATLVLGDFNEASGAALTVLERRGLTSALPEYQPASTTWRWQTSLGAITQRLDHVFYGPALTPLEARVIAAGRSDHLPVVAVFERTGARAHAGGVGAGR